jgi:hypothetical protein
MGGHPPAPFGHALSGHATASSPVVCTTWVDAIGPLPDRQGQWVGSRSWLVVAGGNAHEARDAGLGVDVHVDS